VGNWIELVRVLRNLERRQRRLQRRVAFLEANAEGIGIAQAAVGHMINLPAVRGVWIGSMTASDTNSLRDLSGVGAHLSVTNIISGRPVLHIESGAPVFEYLGFDYHYSSGASPDWSSIIGTDVWVDAAYRGLTLGGWHKFSAVASAREALISKWLEVGQECYRLSRDSSGYMNFHVNDGASTTSVASADTVGADVWVWTAARFTPSNELKVWINEDSWTETSSVPASLNSATPVFQLGNHQVGASPAPFTGYAAYRFLAAAALPDAMIEDLFEDMRAWAGV